MGNTVAIMALVEAFRGPSNIGGSRTQVFCPEGTAVGLFEPNLRAMVRPRSGVTCFENMTSQLDMALSLTKPQRPIDLDALYVIYRASMYHSTNKARGKPWNDRRERRQFIEQVNPDTVALIEVDGAIAGFIDLRSEDGALIVHTLVLHSEHQSKGIGTAVMQGICSLANKQGCQVRLFVLKANKGAKRFYQRLGFAVASSSTYHDQMIYCGQSRRRER